MWTKILIFMVVFFLVANPATFKIVRGLLGGWVASSEGLATPAGLVLHAAVFVGLAIFLPKALMRASGYEDEEEYEDDEEYEEEEEEYEDEDGEGFRRGRRCAAGQYYNKVTNMCTAKPTCPPDQRFTRYSSTGCKPRCSGGRVYDMSRARGKRCVAPPTPIVAPGAAPPTPAATPAAAAPAATVAATPVVTVPVATTSTYEDEEEYRRRSRRARRNRSEDYEEEFMTGYAPY